MIQETVRLRLRHSLIHCLVTFLSPLSHVFYPDLIKKNKTRQDRTEKDKAGRNKTR
jgi:hypothetical protein